MSKSEARIVELGGNGSGGPAGGLRVAVLGAGFSAQLWIDRLRALNVPFAHLTLSSPDRPSWDEADLLIETEDLRLPEYYDEHADDLELGPGLSAPAHSHAHDHDHDHEDEIELSVAAGGVVLAPCYGVSPTQTASTFAESAPNVVGYTLFPRPRGAADDAPHTIEIARPLQVEDAIWDRAQVELERLGFRPEIVGDAPGGVFGRTLACLINEAAYAYSDGIASVSDIDNAMKLGVNYPRGLFEWADSLGIDLILEILEGLHEHYQDDRYRPAPLLRHLILASYRFYDL